MEFLLQSRLRRFTTVAYPSALIVSFKPEGARAYVKDSVSISLSSSGTTSVSVNVTMNCSTGACVAGGVSLLPMNYTLS